MNLCSMLEKLREKEKNLLCARDSRAFDVSQLPRKGFKRMPAFPGVVRSLLYADAALHLHQIPKASLKI